MSAAAETSKAPCDPLLGNAFALANSYDTTTVRETALSYLGVEPTDRVLEIGFGDGRMLSELAARAFRGFVAGIDPSERMRRHALQRNRRFVDAGRVALLARRSSDLEAALGGGSDLPFGDPSREGSADRSLAQPFDKVLGLHVVYFWFNARQNLTEIHRVLRPGGRLVLGFRPDAAHEQRGPRALDRSPSQSPERMAKLLSSSGFANIETVARRHADRPIAWTVAERNPD